MRKRISKYIATVDYFDKTLIVLYSTGGGVSIASFTSVIRTPGGIASASLGFCVFFNCMNHKKLLKTTRNKNKKHNKIFMLAN